VAGNADLLRVDDPAERTGLGVGPQQLVDHEPDVSRLVDDVALVRAARRARVGEGKVGAATT